MRSKRPLKGFYALVLQCKYHGPNKKENIQNFWGWGRIHSSDGMGKIEEFGLFLGVGIKGANCVGYALLQNAQYSGPIMFWLMLMRKRGSIIECAILDPMAPIDGTNDTAYNYWFNVQIQIICQHFDNLQCKIYIHF